jgi:hypothetical protein
MTAFLAGFITCAVLCIVLFVYLNRKKSAQLDAVQNFLRK